MGEIEVRVTPKSSRNRVDASASPVKVYVTAPPADGEANAAVVEVVAKALGIAKSKVSIVRGHTSRNKVLTVEGLERAEILSKLGQGELF